MHVKDGGVRLEIRRICQILSDCYGDPHHGNKNNPLDELVYIILSNRTLPSAHQAAYRALKRYYRSWNSLRPEELDNVQAILRPSGFSRLRSTQIVHILERIRARFDRCTLAPLNGMSDELAEEFLLTLPGVSKKVAKCVLMYSLNRQVLPVDVHVHRIATRLGIPTKKRPDTSQDIVESAVPTDLRYGFHVNAIAHGRRICLPRNAKCHACPIEMYCGKIGIAEGGKAHREPKTNSH